SSPIPSSAPRSTGTARDVSPRRLRLKAGGVGANNRAGRGAEDELGATRLVAMSIPIAPWLRRPAQHARSNEVLDPFAGTDRGDPFGVARPEALGIPDLDVVVTAGHDHVAVEGGVLAEVR